MFINNKLFKKIITPFIDNPSARKGTQYSYPAIAIDTGDEYIVSYLYYANRPDLPFNVPFTFHFEYDGKTIHEDDVTNVWLYTKTGGIEDAYSRQYVPGRIFETKDVSDFCLMLYKSCNKQGSSSHDIIIYRNFELFTELHNVEEIKHHVSDLNEGAYININSFRIDRIDSGIFRGSNIKRVAVINGKEVEASQLNLSFKAWNELFSDSGNTYCDLENLYSGDNEIPYEAEKLRWDSKKKSQWRCCFGHSWEKPITEYTRYVQIDNPCPECSKLLPGLTPRILQYQADLIVDAINYVVKKYSEPNLGRLRETLNNDCIKLRRRLEKAIESGSSLWIHEEEMPSQVKYYFIHPNGKQSDIDMYICEKCGSISEIQEFLYEAIISTEHKEEIVALYGNTWISDDYKDILCEKYSKSEALQIINNKEISEFLVKHHLFYEYEKLSVALKYLTMFSLNPQEADHELYRLRPKTGDYRQTVYNQVVFEGKSSGRWVSEQSLYRLVRQFFSDAIYQYHVSWLGYQSLDIYVPSIRVGIEYQGAQHYEAVDLFGGEEALKDRKALDAKKRKLCKKNDVTLIEWKYTKEISRSAVFEVLYEWIRKANLSSTQETSVSRGDD